MLGQFSTTATRRSRQSSMTAGARIVRNHALVLIATACLCGCSRMRQTAELWQEQRQLTERAREAQEQGDMSQATNLLTQAVNADPRNCETRLELSEMLLEHGSLDAATQHLRRVVAQNPDDPRGYVRLAQALSSQGRDAEAESLLRTALEIDPGNPTGLLLFAQWLEKQGEIQQALETYYRAIPLLGNPAEAELRIAAIKLRAGQNTQATALLRGVVENSQACPAMKGEAYALLGRAYGRDERWRDAASALETGLKLQPNLATAADWRLAAEAHALSGDWTAASRCAAAASGQSFTAPGSGIVQSRPITASQVGFEQPSSGARDGEEPLPHFAARP